MSNLSGTSTLAIISTIAAGFAFFEPVTASPIVPATQQVQPPAGGGGDRTLAALPRDLYGAWSTDAGGGVWTSPSQVPGGQDLDLDAKALPGLLVIYADGTYVWNTSDGKRGRWRPATDPMKPIQLIDAKERYVWNVGPDPDHPGCILIAENSGRQRHAGRRP